MINHERLECLLKVDNVNLSFPGKQVLRDINFCIYNITRPGVLQGQVVSLIGRSGIGKTQLFRILAGLKKPDTGQVLINKEQHAVHAGDMGVVPQNYYLFPWRKVGKNLALAAAKNPNLKDGDAAKVIAEYAADFGLTEHLDKYPMQLSGGQRQRASIIQQLINGSNFLLLDEPFSGLDAISIKQVTAVLNKVSLSDELKTLIIVSHDLENALALSDTALILRREEGKEGATITHNIDLISRDLCWHQDLKRRPEFQALIQEVEALL
jgi:polar amino acid transport system ATP-binding protein/sulfate transport system ATP-binding protein/NitT/TauT family transport system ATP-binding protein